MMAQEAALKEVANSKLRCLLAYNKSFNCTDVAIGDSVLLHETVTRKSTPSWHGPAGILDPGDAGATVKFRSQTF